MTDVRRRLLTIPLILRDTTPYHLSSRKLSLFDPTETERRSQFAFHLFLFDPGWNLNKSLIVPCVIDSDTVSFGTVKLLKSAFPIPLQSTARILAAESNPKLAASLSA